MKVELLYFDGCSSWHTAHAHLKSVLAENGQDDIEPELIRVETAEAALATQFVGSPTIRIDGQDLFPVNHTNYALGCRVYQTPEGMRGWPTEQMLKDAFTRHLS